MSKTSLELLWLQFKRLLRSLASCVIFYTIIPLPQGWIGEWQRVARWSPLVGLTVGATLGLLSLALRFGNFPNLTSSAIIVAMWVGITGGLHLDGVMDAADGLAVTDISRRLEVMKDSATGAYGAIAAVIIILLKTVALSETTLPLWLVLMLAASWARWGQVAAIACYPYLRETGTGAFHKENLRLPQDLLLGLVFILLFDGVIWWLEYLTWWQIVFLNSVSCAIALLTGYYFYWQLKGHTGDTYGAVVEWTEVFILCLLTAF
ncbi:adenosylcobinamide-GDP ribazoletransferase [Myxosarcina sp. GI1]|uniref:adenosylcobinamide-GDP ribazoletransferase n=1 Tax=Myxosarcina sp. GI1 TaxID=1541065 RepID=UPI00055EFAB6|nr:adenosylcobinamide-GDP ribazoletransferase [Myxosarcina sp. GI1]